VRISRIYLEGDGALSPTAAFDGARERGTRPRGVASLGLQHTQPAPRASRRLRVGLGLGRVKGLGLGLGGEHMRQLANIGARRGRVPASMQLTRGSHCASVQHTPQASLWCETIRV
jgi:hypothetical protein